MVHLVTVVSHSDNATLTMMQIRMFAAYRALLVDQARIHISWYIVAVVNQRNPCRYVVRNDEVYQECDKFAGRCHVAIC